MRLILAVLVLFLVVAAIIWRKRRRAGEIAAAGERNLALTATGSKFHAVSIRPGLDACAAAQALQGERFLSDTAPPIPLPDCDSRNCRCRFVHFTDRRDGDDRRSPYPGTIGIDSGTFRREQRESSDRRGKPPKDL